MFCTPLILKNNIMLMLYLEKGVHIESSIKNREASQSETAQTWQTSRPFKYNILRPENKP